MLTVAQLAPLKDRDPYLYETLVKIVSSVNATSQRAGVDPSTPAPAPSPIASVSVQLVKEREPECWGPRPRAGWWRSPRRQFSPASRKGTGHGPSAARVGLRSAF